MDALEAAIALTAKLGLRPSPSWQQSAQSTPVRLIRCARLPRSRGGKSCGCTSMAPFGGLAAMAVPEKFQGLSSADLTVAGCAQMALSAARLRLPALPRQAVARETFSHSGDYVKVFNEGPTESFVFFEETMELSRRFRALKLWMSLQYHGRRAFRAAIARDLNHAQQLAQAVQSHPDLELLAPVPLSAVCFRHREKDNEAILKRIIARAGCICRMHGQWPVRAAGVFRQPPHERR